MLLAMLVSAEEPPDESDEAARVNGGTALVEAIDTASSSCTTCTADVDLELVLLEYIKSISRGLFCFPSGRFQFYKLKACHNLLSQVPWCSIMDGGKASKQWCKAAGS